MIKKFLISVRNIGVPHSRMLFFPLPFRCHIYFLRFEIIKTQSTALVVFTRRNLFPEIFVCISTEVKNDWNVGNVSVMIKMVSWAKTCMYNS